MQHSPFDHVVFDFDDASTYPVLEPNSHPVTSSTFRNLSADADGNRFAIRSDVFGNQVGPSNELDDGALIYVYRPSLSLAGTVPNPGYPLAIIGLATDDDFELGGAYPNVPAITFAAGITLKFAPTMALSVGGGNVGPAKLVVAGTAASHVTLGPLSPSKGWRRIWIDGGDGLASATLHYADVSFGTTSAVSGERLGEIYVGPQLATDGVLTMDHASVTDSAGFGIYLECGDSTDGPYSPLEVDGTNTFARNANGDFGLVRNTTGIGSGDPGGVTLGEMTCD